MTSSDVTRFLEKGRLERLPRKADDRVAVYAWLAAQITPVEGRVTERELMDALIPLAHDPVGARRDMVELGLIGREPDGSAYWRAES